MHCGSQVTNTATDTVILCCAIPTLQ